jgi:hypothetical protein
MEKLRPFSGKSFFAIKKLSFEEILLGLANIWIK